MPKKGENSKAVEARSRKEDNKRAASDKAATAAEDREWAAAGEGAKSKAQAKKQEQAQQREQAAAKKAEAKRLAEEEEASLSSASKAAVKRPASKVTSHQLQLQKEADKREQDEKAKQAQKAAKREVSEDDYDSLVAVPNINRQADEEPSARTVEGAISLLSVNDASEPEDRHPERRAKAAFAAYQERELPQLKLDRPGLKHSQYKDALWKQWQKAPENPMNRVAS
ncbi:hypothetical protein WJX73_009945 [Symbiochloris irregularis]|uniref:Coiled-coil domain-containing protein n=1 Tax=Symbiochloris irregularis TaxID=706552 RepID=A0AAW1P0N8_9CHLO